MSCLCIQLLIVHTKGIIRALVALSRKIYAKKTFFLVQLHGCGRIERSLCRDVKQGQMLEAEVEARTLRPRPNLRGRGRGQGQM